MRGDDKIAPDGSEIMDPVSLLGLVDMHKVPSVEDRVKNFLAREMARYRRAVTSVDRSPGVSPLEGVEDDPDGVGLTHAEEEYRLSVLELDLKREEADFKLELAREAAIRASMPPVPSAASVPPAPPLPKAV